MWVITVVAACVAVFAAYQSFRSRQAAERAGHRADKPHITVVADGEYGKSPGLMATFSSDVDLDVVKVTMGASALDGKPHGFSGLWTGNFGLFINESKFEAKANPNEVTFYDVKVGKPFRTWAQVRPSDIPRTARLDFRVDCKSGDRDPWVLDVRSEEVQIVWNPYAP